MEDVAYDIHFTKQGPFWITQRGKNFLNTHSHLPVTVQYRLAHDSGLTVSAETEELREQLSCAVAGNTRTSHS